MEETRISVLDEWWTSKDVECIGAVFVSLHRLN